MLYQSSESSGKISCLTQINKVCPMKILILEDDTILCESLQEYLQLEGFSVEIAQSAEQLYELTFTQKFDLYIFDINLPDENGFTVLQNLMASGDTTPTIYITALTDIQSITQGFSLGAIDYIKKPFDPEELVVRINSRFSTLNQHTITYGELNYNPTTQELFRGDSMMSLGIVQQQIFHELITQVGQLIPQERLLDLLEHPNPNALRVNVAKLKNKLGIEIKNIRSQGYLLEKL
jgi:DNA-binding response OmpR family regulator